MTDVQTDAKEPEGFLGSAVVFAVFLILTLSTVIYSLSFISELGVMDKRKRLAAKEADQEKLLKCRVYARSGLEEAKGRLLWQWKKDKTALGSFKFTRRMGSSYAGGHDEFVVMVESKEAGRYKVSAEGVLYMGTLSRYSGQLAQDESRPSSKRASYTLVVEFDFKDGQLSNETAISGLGWLPEQP